MPNVFFSMLYGERSSLCDSSHSTGLTCTYLCNSSKKKRLSLLGDSLYASSAAGYKVLRFAVTKVQEKLSASLLEVLTPEDGAEELESGLLHTPR